MNRSRNQVAGLTSALLLTLFLGCGDAPKREAPTSAQLPRPTLADRHASLQLLDFRPADLA